MVMLENVALKVRNVWNVAEVMTPHEPAPPPRRAQNTMYVGVNQIRMYTNETVRALTVGIFILICGNERAISQYYGKFYRGCHI